MLDRIPALLARSPRHRGWRGRSWNGLSVTALGSGFSGAILLEVRLLGTVSIVLGVGALVTGAGAWIRSTPAARWTRTAALVGALLGAVALGTAAHRVGKTVIEIDRSKLVQRH